MEKLELLKEKIENIGFNPIWYADLDPESEEDQIFVKIGDAESKSISRLLLSTSGSKGVSLLRKTNFLP